VRYWIGAIPAMVFLGIMMMPFCLRAGGQPDPAGERLQCRLPWPVVVLAQCRAGSQGDDGLAECAVVAPVHGMAATAVVRGPRAFHVGSRRVRQ
jgi:hypothetical protein